MKTMYFHILCQILIAVTTVIPLCAQQAHTDDKLLDEFIMSKGYNHPIIFDTSNIKQFWVDNTVASNDYSILVSLSNRSGETLKSNALPIQLANVDVTQDCRVDIVAEDDLLDFSIFNRKNKKISSSTLKDRFLSYNILTSSFHLKDTEDFFFNIAFSTKMSSFVAIKKIILSFSNHTQDFLRSPGTLIFNINNITTNGTVVESINNNNSFSLTGNNTQVFSSPKIYLSKALLKNRVKVKNIGETPTRIFLGYVCYLGNGVRFDNSCLPYNWSNQVLKVVSHEADSNIVLVDSYPEKWSKGCYLVLNAKEDFSDFPNTSFIGRIQEIKQNENSQTMIIFSKPISKAIKKGTSVRIQGPSGSYLYTNIKVIQPGEEVELSGSIQKDDQYVEYSSKAFCREVYYVIPVLLSYSIDSKEKNKVLISDFTVSY